MNSHEGDAVWDVAIVGGGSAGLSAALTLARARRSVLVIDSGTPRNAPAAAAHGLLALDGINPMELLARGREQASGYGAEIVDSEVVDSHGSAADGFVIRLSDDTVVRAGQVLLATGVRDELPAVPGLAERWGRDVVHCPYCHGWEIRDQRIGLLATAPMAAMQALQFHQWTDELTFFPGRAGVPPADLDMLTDRGITIVPGEVGAVDVVDDRLAGVLLADGTRVELDAVAVHSYPRARLDGLAGLGVDVDESAVAAAVVADAAGRTSVPGVWAAGNLAQPMMQVSEAAANGARVAMMINSDLIFAGVDMDMGAYTGARRS